MSLSQLFQPNSYDLYCRSISANSLVQNIVVNNPNFEVEIPSNGGVLNLYPTSITTWAQDSKIKVELMATIWGRLSSASDGSPMLAIRLMRGDVSVYSGFIATNAGMQNPIYVMFIDSPNSESRKHTYSWEIDSLQCPTCYITSGSTTQIVLTEIHGANVISTKPTKNVSEKDRNIPDYDRPPKYEI